MFELNTTGQIAVKDETEKSSLTTPQTIHTSCALDLDTKYETTALKDVSTPSVLKHIHMSSINVQVAKLENGIDTIASTVVDVVIKLEFQDTGGPAKKSCRIKNESETHSSFPSNNGKEKKNPLHRNRIKQSTKSLKHSASIDKKKCTSAKKPKYKKYEKPSDPVLKHYQCTLCPKVFQRSSNFNAHQRTHNPLTARPFSCQDCKNTFHYRCQLRDHARIHTGERPFKCHSCSKTFARKGCLVAHMVTHSDALPFQCDICCKRFARKYNLVKHVQSHSGERPYRCLNCSRRFKCKQSLDKHHRIHELNIYSCAICQESFDTKRRLTRHKINEHVSYRPFTCQICHKPFIFKSQLTYHIKEHNLDRPYSCGKCNKSYFKKGHLLSHIKQYCSDVVPIPQVKLEVFT